MKIRPMLVRDKPSIMKMLHDTPEFKPSEVAVAEEVIDDYLNDPIASGYYALVSVEGQTVTGYICYGPTPLTKGTWDMYWEAVLREKRGQGIGTALMQAAEKDIVKAGGRLAVIETSSTTAYENTVRFHTRRGYEIIARIPDFYGPGDDKIILLRKLVRPYKPGALKSDGISS